MISGQPDALLTGPEDQPDLVEVLDWKLTWALPPERQQPTDHEQQFGHHVSYEGYFQQRFYAFLVMRDVPDDQGRPAARVLPAAAQGPLGDGHARATWSTSSAS